MILKRKLASKTKKSAITKHWQISVNYFFSKKQHI